jgi:acetyl-CoA acetyltransferase
MASYGSLRNLSDQACLVGVGQTDYSKASGRSVTKLALQAARAAIADAGLRPPDIDAILPYVPGPTADEMAAQLGIGDLRYSSMIKMGGATPVANLLAAALLIHSGVARNVLMFCARNGRSGTRVDQRMHVMPAQGFRRDFEQPYGFSVPGQWYAMIARRQMIERGTSRESAADFAVAVRKHANLNPNAMMAGTPMTRDDYFASRPVYDPSCCSTAAWKPMARAPMWSHRPSVPAICRTSGIPRRRRASQTDLFGRSMQPPGHAGHRSGQSRAARF